MPMANIGSGTIEERAAYIAGECERVARRIAFRASKHRDYGHLLQAANGAVAVGALAFAYIIPDSWKILRSISSIVAAVILMIDTIIPTFMAGDSYERLSEYSHYIGLFSEKIQTIFSDQRLDEIAKQNQLRVLVDLAELNLCDVKAKWPSMID